MIQEILQGRFAYAIDSSKLDSLQLTALDVFKNGQRMNLQKLSNLFGGVKIFNHFFLFISLTLFCLTLFNLS